MLKIGIQLNVKKKKIFEFSAEKIFYVDTNSVREELQQHINDTNEELKRISALFNATTEFDFLLNIIFFG